jgi:hypothetical protein
MHNHILDDYLDELKLQLKHLPLAERRQVDRDIRAHLEQEVKERRKADKALSEDEAVLAATHAFGDPKDIGISYGAGGGVVRRSTGEVVLHVAVLAGRGVARTVGKTVKWTAIVAGVLLLLAVAVGLTIVVVYKDTISHNVDQAASRRLVYEYSGAWAAPNVQNGPHTDSFELAAGTRVDFSLTTTPQSGCAAVQVTAPDGTIAYSNGQGCSATQQQLGFTQVGKYTVQYTYAAYTGSVSSYAYQESQPTP